MYQARHYLTSASRSSSSIFCHSNVPVMRSYITASAITSKQNIFINKTSIASRTIPQNFRKYSTTENITANTVEVTSPFDGLDSHGLVPQPKTHIVADMENIPTAENAASTQNMIEQDALGAAAGPAGVPLVFAPDTADINLMGVSTEYVEEAELPKN